MTPPRLSPWDEMGYFDNPQWTVHHVGTGPLGYEQLIGANPRRVLLMFCNDSGVNLTICTDPTVFAQGGGLVIQTSTLPQVFTQADYGILCQSAWYIQNAGAGPAISVCEVLLRTWPGES